MAKDYQKALGLPPGTTGRGKIVVMPRSKIVTNSRKIAITSPYLDDIVPRRENSNFCSDKTIDLALESLTSKCDGDGAPRSKNSSAYPNAKRSAKQYTPVQLLSAFKRNFIQDEPMFNFDYLGFYRICAILMRDVEGIVGPKIARTLNKRTILSMTMGYQLVDYILWDAADTAKLYGSVTGSVLADAAAVIEATIPANGDDFTKEAIYQ